MRRLPDWGAWLAERPLGRGLPAVALLLATLALLFPAGYFNTDELIYSLMAEAATRGELTVENGHDEYPSPGLLARFLVPGPNGTAPQYAAGYGFLAAPFYAFGGLHGLVLLNALAFVLALGVTFRMALDLGLGRAGAFRAVLILALGTYALEYALGIWPHAVSMCFVALAVWLAIRASGDRATPAFLSGLVLGFGVTIRPDVALLAPGLGCWMLLTGIRWRRIFALGAGLLPGLALSAWLNHLRFGSWAALSYGRDSGNASFERYIPLAAAILAGLAAFAVLRRLGFRTRAGLVTLVVAAAAVFAVDPARQLLLALLRGFYVLVIDLQAYGRVGGEPGVVVGEGGYVVFFGVLKRALVQSLPYLGLLPVMVAGFRTSRTYRLVLTLAAFWIAPFALSEWHGGLSFNMRYFVPLLPFLAIASSRAIGELAEALTGSRRPRPKTLGRVGCYAVTVAAISFILVASRPVVGYTLALYVPLALAAALAVACTAFLLRAPDRRPGPAAAALLLTVAAVAWAGTSALVYDLNLSWRHRASVAAVNARTATLEDGIVVVTNIPEYFAQQFLRPDSIVATVSEARPFDVIALIEHYLGRGRRVYIHHENAAGPEVAALLSRDDVQSLDLGGIRLAVVAP